LINHSIFTS